MREAIADNTVEQFTKAPIQEALLDIQVVLPTDVAVSALKSFGQGLEDRFPEQQERFEFVQSLQLNPTGDPQPTPTAKNIEAYLFWSKPNGKTVQAKRDGFTFNKLRPYSRWEDFNVEARELWLRYVGIARPVCIKRASLRYINRIEIPDDSKNLRDLCLLFPDVPAGVPQLWLEYFQRFVSPKPDGTVSIVTLAIDVPAAPGKPAIILDIDVGRLFENAALDTAALWPHFDELRALKNEIFDASLTAKAKALFR